MAFQSGTGDAENHGDWNPRQQLRAADEREVDLSRGFMRCRPEKWFPAFATHWLTLAHSLGVEMRISEVKPVLRAPRSLGLAYYGEALGERIQLFSDMETIRAILASVTPGAMSDAEDVVLEYLARRFLASLGMSWSGPKDSGVSFTGKAETLDMNEAGAVKLAFTVNNQACAIWILLGQSMIEQLDGLWRRQIQSSSRVAEDAQEVRYEIGNMPIPQQELASAVKPGGTIQLESFDPESVTLRRNDRAWLPARMMVCENSFAFETLAVPIIETPPTEKAARVSVVLGSETIEPSILSEITQPGAVLKTAIPASNKVEILVNGRHSAYGVVTSQNGRFAVKVTE